MNPPQLILLAGPNGAGKSTLHSRYLAALGLPFVNNDEIARREFGEAAEERAFTAAKIARAERAALFDAGTSFVMETVLASTPGGVRRLLADARTAGFSIHAHYIGVWPPDLAVLRVTSRVLRGGHHVPDEIVLKRWHRSLANVPLLLDAADSVTLYDNSAPDDPHRFIASVLHGGLASCARALPRWAHGLDLVPRATASTLWF